MLTPQFLAIGNEEIPLTSLITTGPNAYNKISVQTLDSSGFTKKSYTWSNSGGETWDQIGWVDNSTNEIVGDEVTFKPGTSLWVSGANGLGLQFSGIVNKADVTIALEQGSKAIGNPFPVSVKIGDILPSADAGIKATYNKISVQTLDSSGFTVKSYTWSNSGGETWDQIGWVDNDTNEIVNKSVEFPAGQGLWVSGATGLYLTFPAPTM